MQKLVFCLAALVLFISAANAQTPPQAVLVAAQSGLPRFLGLIPPAERSAYGFSESDILTQAYLGTPFNVHTITPSVLFAYKPGDLVPALLSTTKLWYFPVMIQNEQRALLVVDQMGSIWQAVSLGYADLAKQLDLVLRQWPRANGFHPCLIAVFQAKVHLILVPEVSTKDLITLTPLKLDLEMESAAVVLERLKPIVAENINLKF
jgi:hypothetical protein